MPVGSQEIELELTDEFAAPVDSRYIARGYVPQSHADFITVHSTGKAVLYSVLAPVHDGVSPVFTVLEKSDTGISLQADGSSWNLTFEPERVRLDR